MYQLPIVGEGAYTTATEQTRIYGRVNALHLPAEVEHPTATPIFPCTAAYQLQPDIALLRHSIRRIEKDKAIVAILS